MAGPQSLHVQNGLDPAFLVGLLEDYKEAEEKGMRVRNWALLPVRLMWTGLWAGHWLLQGHTLQPLLRPVVSVLPTLCDFTAEYLFKINNSI